MSAYAAADAAASAEVERPDAVVVVATRDRSERLPRLVAALEGQTFPRDRFEVVICDDGSTDDTPQVLHDLAARSSLAIRILRVDRAAGPAGARNAAWQASSAPLVACTDDDCAPEPEWLESGVRLLLWDPGIGVVQGRTEKPLDATSYPWTDWTVFREIRQPTPWFEGCNLFFRREALEAAGGFDEGIGWFGEETALGWGVLAAGWDRAFADDAVVRHDLGERGVRWHARHRYLEGTMVDIARRYPQLRQSFWRPWALHRQNAEFALAVAGAVAAIAGHRPVAALVAVPYLRRRLPHPGHPRFFRLFAERVAVDAAALAGMIRASARHRRLVL